MSDSPSQVVTRLLADLHNGDLSAQAKLIGLVYAELRRLAGAKMREERNDHTLQTTALVNEALLRLLSADALRTLKDRRHLYGVVAEAMRRILIEHARARATDKRGGGYRRIPLDDVVDAFKEQELDLLDVEGPLSELASLNLRQYEVLVLRYFGGLTVPEIAAVVDRSLSTIEADLRFAKAWLRSCVDR